MSTIEGTVIHEHDPGTEVALRTQQAVSLFGTDDPAGVVEKASAVATALAGVVERRQLFTMIQGRKHVKVEGWTLLGTMLGVFPVLESCEPVERDGVKGYEAIVAAQTRDGQIVGRASALCMRSENTWRNRDEYTLASMAQTRATSKCLRAPLGFVMQLAGYEATPEAEMPVQASHEPAQRPQQARAAQNPSRAAAAPTGTPGGVQKASAPQKQKIHLLVQELQEGGVMTEEQYRRALVAEFGVESSVDLTKAQASNLIERLVAAKANMDANAAPVEATPELGDDDIPFGES